MGIFSRHSHRRESTNNQYTPLCTEDWLRVNVPESPSLTLTIWYSFISLCCLVTCCCVNLLLADLGRVNICLIYFHYLCPLLIFSLTCCDTVISTPSSSYVPRSVKTVVTNATVPTRLLRESETLLFYINCCDLLQLILHSHSPQGEDSFHVRKAVLNYM